MAIKLVWGYAIVVLLGGFAMLLYARWQESSGWVAFAASMIGMFLAVGLAMWRASRKKARAAADDAAPRG